MTYYILPYKQGSKSAKALAHALGCKRIKKENSRFVPRLGRTVINWGCSEPHPRVQHAHILNDLEFVAAASNKIHCLELLDIAEVPTLTWTTCKDDAQSWLIDGKTVYARALINSHSGRGISIHRDPSDQLPDVPLYTKKFKTEHEYRVHVVKDKIIHIAQKRLRNDAPSDRVVGVRNHTNGWIFAHNDMVELSEENQQIAIKGIQAIGLDFGAVDLLVNRHGKAVICEINTAPGLEGTTLQRYKEAFTNLEN